MASGCCGATGRHRQILPLFLDRLQLLEQQIATRDRSLASALHKHREAVARLAEVPGFGVDSAHQVIAEVGPEAATFSTAAELASWVGVCPGREESAEQSKSNRSPKGNRLMRRILNQVAHAAVRTKGSVLQTIYRRLLPRLGHNKAIWAVAHRLCRLTWKMLRQSVKYVEYGQVPNPKARQKRTARLLRELRSLGYQVQIVPTLTQAPA